jgi:hypothetical protein
MLMSEGDELLDEARIEFAKSIAEEQRRQAASNREEEDPRW